MGFANPLAQRRLRRRDTQQRQARDHEAETTRAHDALLQCLAETSNRRPDAGAVSSLVGAVLRTTALLLLPRDVDPQSDPTSDVSADVTGRSVEADSADCVATVGAVTEPEPEEPQNMGMLSTSP